MKQSFEPRALSSVYCKCYGSFLSSGFSFVLFFGESGWLRVHCAQRAEKETENPREKLIMIHYPVYLTLMLQKDDIVPPDTRPIYAPERPKAKSTTIQPFPAVHPPSNSRFSPCPKSPKPVRSSQTPKMPSGPILSTFVHQSRVPSVE
ncbi:hypothetical protein N657DRAFT_47787 [Parathielavia appendiculata]|uniref:Uncharacterized protein n=1 Tax=Parathielavia appendiculata TaxID=2587402 RepID=A0AAN6U9Q4_9PEZI|nr:hypothetical protein N657DRAFT_47787 [Parathielavia appendiculata]